MLTSKHGYSVWLKDELGGKIWMLLCGVYAWKCFKREARVLKKSLPLMPTYYTLHCLALLQPVRTCFVNYMQQFFVSPPTKTLKKWYCFFRNNDWLQILSSWLWRGGGWEKYWNEHGLFFVQKMSVYICSMSDGCNLEKKCIGDGYSSSVFTPTLLLTGSIVRRMNFLGNYFGLYFFSPCIEKQRRATRRDTKNSKVLLRW